MLKTTSLFNPSEPIAHRGNCGASPPPENTLAAIRKAYKLGATYIECDVKLAKRSKINDQPAKNKSSEHRVTGNDETDRKVVMVIHDDTLERTTNAQGVMAKKLISEMTYEEISQFDAGIKYGPEYAGEKIPTLVQFLRLIRKLNLGLILEIKPIRGQEIETARETVRVLRECNFIDYPKLLVQGFLAEVIGEVKRLEPRLQTGLLMDEWWAYTRIKTDNIINEAATARGLYRCHESIIELLQKLKCTALVAHHRILTPELVKEVKCVVPYVLCWEVEQTIDHRERARQLYDDIGVDAIISDHPDQLICGRDPSLLSTNAAFFKQFEKLYLRENRDRNPRIREEYDKQCGLTIIPERTF